jgi:type I restriction enzyme S subunit
MEIHDSEDHLTERGLEASTSGLLPEGSLLMVVRSGILQHTIPIAITRTKVTVNQDIRVIRPTVSIQPDYLLRQIQGLQKPFLAEWVKQGATVESVEQKYFAETPMVVPPQEEQADIAAYLDGQMREVDALIADKEGLLLLLAEYRRAIITEAVTKGINQDSVTRESNIGWLGEFPKHWKLVPLKRMAVMRGGHTPSTDRPEFWDGQIPWISPKDMKRDELWDSEDHISVAALKETNLGLLEPGSTLIVVRGMILAHTFPVGLNRVQATINQDMKALFPIRHVSQEYLPALLRGLAHIFLSLVDESAHGTKALRTEKFVNEPLPIPPADEQIEILEYIQAETAKVDELIEHTRVHIDALREYKSALISEAVTGQIDVRGYGGDRFAGASKHHPEGF